MITPIITAYRRPHTIQPLVAALRAQTVKPDRIWAWANDPTPEVAAALAGAGLDRIVTSSENTYFHGRFALALLAPTEYVAIFDDDSIPGPDWFDNCLATMAQSPGILGTTGVLLRGPSYAQRSMRAGIGPVTTLARSTWSAKHGSYAPSGCGTCSRRPSSLARTAKTLSWPHALGGWRAFGHFARHTRQAISAAGAALAALNWAWNAP
jgi:GT2 family glycosyltransferase